MVPKNEMEMELLQIIRDSADPAKVAEFLISALTNYVQGVSLDEIKAEFGIG